MWLTITGLLSSFGIFLNATASSPFTNDYPRAKMKDLPQEIIFETLSNLSFPDLLSCTLVCSVWRYEADRVLSNIGFQVELPDNILRELRSSRDTVKRGKEIIVPVNQRRGILPEGIFELLAHKDLTRNTPWSFDILSSHFSIKCNYLLSDQFHQAANFNNPPIYILHSYGRRIFLEFPYDWPDNSPRYTPPDDALYFEISLPEHFSIRPTAYGLRHHSSQRRAPRSWQLLGSEYAEGQWDVLSDHRGDESIGTQAGSMAVWYLNLAGQVREKKYRVFRLVMTGPSASGPGCRYFHCSGCEIYGSVYVERVLMNGL